MSAKLSDTKQNVLEILRMCRAATEEVSSKSLRPTDDQIFAGIIGVEHVLSDEESQAEINATSSDDYDEWIRNALYDRKKGRIQLENGEGKSEHPSARVFRLGVESIKAGKPSELFIMLLEQIAARSEIYDVLRFAFPRDFPSTVDDNQLSSAGNRARIAKLFRERVKERRGKQPFNEVKAKFKKDMQRRSPQTMPDTVSRALKEAGMDWISKPGPNT